MVAREQRDVQRAIIAAFAGGLAPVAASETGDLGEENDGAVRAVGRLTRVDFGEAGSEAGEQLIRPTMERLLFQAA